MKLRRRNFLKASAIVASLPRLVYGEESWSGGKVTHLIPAASHDRFLIKAIFATPYTEPALNVGGTIVPGRATDSTGTSFAFDATDLTPATRYDLQLVQGRSPISDPWPLKTFPDPDAKPESLRLLVFTCAGGHPLLSEGENSIFQPMATRRRLLARGLEFAPDAMIAIGDHVYWDQRTLLESSNRGRRERSEALYNAVGMLDRDLPALGTTNEAILKVAAGEQITPLYGTSLRSTPAFFLNDDHDYFENDEATERFVTLPPYNYQKLFFRFMRDVYFPEFLPTPGRTRPLSGDFGKGLNNSYGALRFGQLAEVLMYDCAGYLSLKGETAGLVPSEVETWLHRRTADERIGQLLHIPSHPMGWSAGKWREWYPDVADTGAGGAQVAQMGVEGAQFKLTTDKPKFMWQRGWWEQHQRLLSSLSLQSRRPAMVLSGDLHATGHARIMSSGNLQFSDNPINTFITGPLGTGTAWPSMARGTPPLPASDLRLDSPAPIAEKNGFTIVDITPEDVRMRLFAWRRETDSLADIDQLAPYHDIYVRREGAS
ncbi:MAG: hypothetical protein AAF513_00280 [Pseudomonadota bacterium]